MKPVHDLRKGVPRPGKRRRRGKEITEVGLTIDFFGIICYDNRNGKSEINPVYGGKSSPMGAYRQNRINEEMTKVLAEILRNVKEKSVRENVLTVTGVSCAPDLSNARVFYSFFGPGDKKEVAKGLRNASGYIRSQLARILNLRQTPELTFVFDESIEKGAKIERILDAIKNGEKEEKDAEPDA